PCTVSYTLSLHDALPILSVAGRLLVRTEAGVESRLVAPDRALLCIPNLCIHFDREANAGKTWNYQVDLQPICGLEGDARLMDVLAAEAGVEAGNILAHDLVLCTRQKARSEEHTSELQSRFDLVCRLLLEKKKRINDSQ